MGAEESGTLKQQNPLLKGGSSIHLTGSVGPLTNEGVGI